MKVLLVDDCLSTDFILVLKESRPDQTPESAIFAVVTEIDDHGLFCGLVTSEEIDNKIHLNFGQLLEGREIRSTTPDATLYQALTNMFHENLGVLPVLSELGKLVGVITQQNIVQALSRHEDDYLMELQTLNHHVDELERNAITRIKRLFELDETTRNLLVSLGLNLLESNTLQMNIEALTTLMRVRYGAIGILDQSDKSGKTLKYFVHAGIMPEIAKTLHKPPEGHGLLRTAIREKSTLRIEDISKDPRSAGFPPNHPLMKSLLSVPISFDGTAYGEIYLSEKLNGLPFSEDDAWLCENFSSSLAIALNNLEKMKLPSNETQDTLNLTIPTEYFS